MMPDNNWYGHRRILREYCGEAGHEGPAFASIMHGWQLDLLPGQGARRITTAPHLVWSERHRSQAAGAGVPNVRAVGAPFVYLASLLAEREPNPGPGKGTLVFPYHGTPSQDVAQDRHALIRTVEEESEGPFTVSVFFADLKKPEVRKPFTEAGWRIVSFGQRDSDDFLYRLHGEVLRHEMVLADRVGTAVWCSGYLGRSVRVLGPRLGPQAGWAGFDPAKPKKERSMFPELHGEGLDPEAARSLAGSELGAGCMLDPASLGELLGWRSPLRRLAARCIAWAVDLKYGKAYREGTAERPRPWMHWWGRDEEGQGA